MRCDGQTYLIPDAVASVTATYYTGPNGFVVSSYDALIASKHCLTMRAEQPSGYAHIFSEDETAFEDVKVVLPRHYLHLEVCTSYRVPLQFSKRSKEEIVCDTVEIVNRVVLLHIEKI